MPITNDTEIVLKLNWHKANLVINALRKLPHEVVDDLIQDVRAQIIPQVTSNNVQELRPGAAE